MFEKTLRDPTKDIRVKLIQFEKQFLPAFLKEMQLDENETAAIMDEFSLFLFNVSEVAWLKGKQNIIRFQEIIRWYREKISQRRLGAEAARDNRGPGAIFTGG